MLPTSFNRTIWMFWQQGFESAPPLVKACVKSWQVQNPDWSVITLDQHDIEGLWDTDDERAIAKKASHAALSDLVRMKLLLKEGGVWADATLACKMPLDNWLWIFFAGGFFAFGEAPAARPMDTFFLAAGKDNPLLRQWLLSCTRAWAQASVKSVDPVNACGRWFRLLENEGKRWIRPDFWHEIEVMPYYWAHYIFDYLLTHNQDFAAGWQLVPRCSARVPLVMELANAFNENAVSDAAFENLLHNTMTPVHKLNWRRMDPLVSKRVSILLEHCCQNDYRAQQLGEA